MATENQITSLNFSTTGGVIPAVAEVAREDGAQPGKVTADDASVKP